MARPDAPQPEAINPRVVAALGVGQVLGWGSTYYLPAVLARPIAADTGWALSWVVAGLTIGSMTAGLLAPRIGRLIQTRGGRPVMSTGAVLLAAGLVSLGLASSLPLYLLSWTVVGLGMACSLYEAAFSTLGKLYGPQARRAITALTLIGGLSSTICWPLSAFLLGSLGWRGTCLAYAALHLGLTLPLYALVLPNRMDGSGSGLGPTQARTEPIHAGVTTRHRWLLFALLAISTSLGWAISSVLSVHLLTLLQTRGLDLAAAVAFGVLVGPAQVGGRAVEMLLGRHYSPIWTLVISVVLVACGLGLLAVEPATTATALVCYGAGAGVASIARGTLPLTLFGAEQYPIWLGRLAGPTLIAGAVSPALAAVLLDRAGGALILDGLAILALGNVGVAGLLWLARSRDG